MRTIDAARSKQLLSADYSELLTKLVTNQVLSAITAIEREIKTCA